MLVFRPVIGIVGVIASYIVARREAPAGVKRPRCAVPSQAGHP